MTSVQARLRVNVAITCFFGFVAGHTTHQVRTGVDVAPSVYFLWIAAILAVAVGMWRLERILRESPGV